MSADLISFFAEGSFRAGLSYTDEFRPDEISILEDALEDAWRRVEESKAPWASDGYSTAGRTILTQHIIKMARDGERDPRWLADSALLYLSQQKLTRTPPEAL